MKVKFYENDKIKDDKLKIVVIMARFKEKWIMVRHKDRLTWELPAGHIEEESVNEAASRELYEETGAVKFQLYPVNTYSVSRLGNENFGQLYYAKVYELDKLPDDSEIAEIKFVGEINGDLTYPLIQPFLVKRVIENLHKIQF